MVAQHLASHPDGLDAGDRKIFQLNAIHIRDHDTVGDVKEITRHARLRSGGSALSLSHQQAEEEW